MKYLQLPNEILPHVRRLSAVQLAIWADAYTWEQQGKIAYRTNGQLAEMLGTSSKSVSAAIAGLIKHGLMESTMKNGRQRILKAIYPVEGVPSRSTSIPLNFHAASRPTSTLHPVELPPCIPSNFHQVEKVSKEVSREVSREGEIVFPWDSEEFNLIWAEWIDERKQLKYKKYTKRGEQAALHKLQKLSNGHEQTAREIIAQSIANGWRGFFELKTSQARGNNLRGKPALTAEDFADIVTRDYR